MGARLGDEGNAHHPVGESHLNSRGSSQVAGHSVNLTNPHVGAGG